MSDIKKYFVLFRVKKITELDEKELKRRYRFLAHRYHPDKGGTSSQFRMVQEAYEYILGIINNKQPAFKPNKTTGPQKYYCYSDGSIFDIEKNRWMNKKVHGIWVIQNYKYIPQIIGKKVNIKV